jgi:F1F0 ATPase subunit 2
MSNLIIPLVCGFFVGLFFFGGLAWTIARGLRARCPALIFGLSYFIRLGVVIGSFVLVSSGQAERVFSCVLGLVIARFLAVRLVRGGSVCI